MSEVYTHTMYAEDVAAVVFAIATAYAPLMAVLDQTARELVRIVDAYEGGVRSRLEFERRYQRQHLRRRRKVRAER